MAWAQGRGERLSAEPLQFGLVVERVDLRRPADQVDKDHRLGSRREMRRARRERAERIDHRLRGRRSRHRLLVQQCLECQRAEAGPELGKKSASRTVTGSVIHR